MLGRRSKNNDVDYDVSAPRTAGLLLEIFPVSKLGTVGLAIHNAGPELLTQDEAVKILKRAAAQLDRSATWRPEPLIKGGHDV